MTSPEARLRHVRFLIAIVIGGLVLSGLSAFPLRQEAEILQHWTKSLSVPSAVSDWTNRVNAGLRETDRVYPFLGYGTDWLAFGHFIIALFFVGAVIDPARNVWIVRAGMVACVLVIPTAMVCGAWRGIPPWWRAIDCSFGVIGFIPLWIAERMIRRLPATAGL
jgi:hypothetical protein